MTATENPFTESAALKTLLATRLARACVVWARTGEDCGACGGPVIAGEHGQFAVRFCLDCGADVKQ
jgi:formamidopyrimidine-DNA glycosylase